jgi:plastocyanin
LRGARLFSIVVALGATLLTGGVASAAGHLVRITSTLDPATITIAPGDRITWRNDDDDRHRIRTTSGPREFDSGNLEPGQAFSVRLTAPGRYEYYDHRNDELTRYYGTVIVRDGAPSDPDEPGPDEPGTPGAESPSRATIAIGDRVFRPRNVTIAAGGSVTWRNDDDREHTATASGDGFDTGVLSPGESARESFPNAGTFSFLCVIHPEMTGTVTVTGSGGGGPPPATPAPEPTPKPDDQKPNPDAGADDVVIRDFEFAPTELAVDVGASVTFANRGSAGHTVTADDGSFDSGLINPGSSWEHTFASSGTYAFICAFHPQMAATIRVRDPGGAPPADATASPSPPETPTPSPSPSDPASQPSGAASADPAAGGAVAAEGDASAEVGTAGTSRDIGAVLLGIAAGGGMLLVAGAGFAAVRTSRDPGAR